MNNKRCVRVCKPKIAKAPKVYKFGAAACVHGAHSRDDVWGNGRSLISAADRPAAGTREQGSAKWVEQCP